MVSHDKGMGEQLRGGWCRHCKCVGEKFRAAGVPLQVCGTSLGAPFPTKQGSVACWGPQSRGGKAQGRLLVRPDKQRPTTQIAGAYQGNLQQRAMYTLN